MKGFIRTLEAVMASMLLLGMVLAVAPQVREVVGQEEPGERVEAELAALESSGELSDNLSRDEIREELSDAVPAGYSYRVLVRERDWREDRIQLGPDTSIDYSRTGDSFGVQLFIDSASGLNVTYNGTRFVEERTEAGYVTESLSTGDGTMEFNGTATLRARFHNGSLDGELPERDRLILVNRQVAENLAEVRVAIWRDRSS